jgi:hypothetical protein
MCVILHHTAVVVCVSSTTDRHTFAKQLDGTVVATELFGTGEIWFIARIFVILRSVGERRASGEAADVDHAASAASREGGCRTLHTEEGGDHH